MPAKKEFALTLDENSLTAFLKGEAEATPKTDNNNLTPDEQGDIKDTVDNSIMVQLGLNNNKGEE
ncbi:hypothetical protein [Abyssogena phaseoliformis symbiont]|uniref:hypothetical protein n=1 Tax=Abyssogena phaseoliformis symbiont TaxID=596095 RepID=UPI0019164381|nr:hypothetical protein [Abyssogena phaseoliformis symbiont]MBW5289456.1 hypothetical protein [Candidatus Ruthia sp. Apha_13_S6]